MKRKIRSSDYDEDGMQFSTQASYAIVKCTIKNDKKRMKKNWDNMNSTNDSII
jgi:hypothetical protein